MNEVKLNEIYIAQKHRIDSNNEWELITKVNDDGKDPITLWIYKDAIPSGVSEGSRFKLTCICGYSQKKKKREINGNTTWEQNNSLEVIVEPVADSFDSNETFEVNSNPFSEINAPANPFADANPFANTTDGDLPF